MTTTNSKPTLRYSVEELLTERNNECPKTKEYFKSISQTLLTKPTRSNTKNTSRPARFPKQTTKKDRKPRINTPNTSKSETISKEDKKNQSAFGPMSASTEATEYPGKKLLQQAGIDVEGKTNEELFELEKKLSSLSYSTPAKEQSNTKAPDTDNIKGKDVLENVSTAVDCSSVEDDLESILTDEAVFSKPKADASSMRNSSDLIANTDSWLFGSNNSIGSISFNSNPQGRGKSILDVIQQGDSPKPTHPSHQTHPTHQNHPPHPPPLADEETINKGTEIGNKLLDLLNQGMHNPNSNSNSNPNPNPGAGVSLSASSPAVFPFPQSSGFPPNNSFPMNMNPNHFPQGGSFQKHAGGNFPPQNGRPGNFHLHHSVQGLQIPNGYQNQPQHSQYPPNHMMRHMNMQGNNMQHFHPQMQNQRPPPNDGHTILRGYPMHPQFHGHPPQHGQPTSQHPHPNYSAQGNQPFRPQPYSANKIDINQIFESSAPPRGFSHDPLA